MDSKNGMYLAIAPFGIIVSTLYLLGFWSTFNINFLEYISISDIIKISVYHLSYFGASLLIGATLGFMSNDKAKPPINQDENSPKRFHQKLFSELNLLILIFALSTLTLLYTNQPEWWTTFGLTLTLIFMNRIFQIIIELKILESIQNLKLKGIIITVCTFMVLNAFTVGKSHGEKQKSNTVTACINKTQIETNYIGTLGEYIVFWDKISENVLIVPKNQVGTIQFHYHSLFST